MGTVAGDVFTQNPGNYFLTLDDVQGKKATELLTGGEAIKQSQVQKAGLADLIPPSLPGEARVRAFPIQVNNLTGVANLIQPNDFVDIMASFNQDVETIRPGIISNTLPGISGISGATTVTLTGDILKLTNEGLTKVLLQDIQVLDVIREAAPVGTPTPRVRADRRRTQARRHRPSRFRKIILGLC